MESEGTFPSYKMNVFEHSNPNSLWIFLLHFKILFGHSNLEWLWLLGLNLISTKSNVVGCRKANFHSQGPVYRPFIISERERFGQGKWNICIDCALESVSVSVAKAKTIFYFSHQELNCLSCKEVLYCREKNEYFCVVNPSINQTVEAWRI